MEPDALVQCPYDRSHQVRVSRLPYHLVRCQQVRGVPRQVSPGVSLSPPHGCPLCTPADPGDTAGDRKAWEPPRAWQPPPCREDWDAELSELEVEEPPPFILNVTKGDLPVPCHSSGPAAPSEGPAPRRPRPGTAGAKVGTAGARTGPTRP
ncbi:GTSF1 factor, partial [Dasyornis broadbenti]|nr:GTSF1 factor [Dasyornis broadbenti]